MKKISLLIIIILIFSNPVFSEVKGKYTKTDDKGDVLEITYYDNDNEIAKKQFDNNGVGTLVGKIPDGPIKIYDKDGDLITETFIKNNKTNGDFKDYYKNGKVEYIGTYKNDLVEGLVKGYFENGNLRTEIFTSRGKVNGSYKEYDEEGNLIEEAIYKNDIRISSKIYEYYSAGKIKFFKTLILKPDGDVLRVGYTKGYDENGNVIFESEGFDKEDELHGKYKEYSNGKLLHEGVFNHGKPDGVWKQYWEESGFMAYKIIYKNGEKISQKAYNVRGELIGEQNFQ
jgi:antitoxin component YwqK of YwqJK toxin-antitoxin module